MSIVRTIKSTGDFWMSHKHWANDRELSWEARGVLSYLFSKADSWEINMKDLIKASPSGRDRTRRVMKELEKQGYVTRIKRKNEEGKFFWESEVREIPSSSNDHVKEKTAIPANSAMDGFSVDGSSGDGSSVDGDSGHISNNESSKNDSLPPAKAGCDPENSNPDSEETESSEVRYTDNDWQKKGADWIYDKLKALEVLHPSVSRKDRDEVIDDWAHQLNLMVENDGYTRDEIQKVLVWLLKEDNWWISSGNFASLSGVRQSKKGVRKWDTIVNKYRAEQKFRDNAEKKPIYARDVNMAERRSRTFK